LRVAQPDQLFPFLVEPGEKIEEVFILSPDPIDPNLVSLSGMDMTSTLAPKLPFMKPSGSQSPQIGPVFKRSFTSKKPGPSKKILNSTLKEFAEIVASNKPWSEYFGDILAILGRSHLRLPDGSIFQPREAGYDSILEGAVERLGPKKATVFLAVADCTDRLPGQRPEYLEFLMTEKLAGDRYVTGAAPERQNAVCPLCGGANVTVFPNAVKGAGINIGNADRDGAFPGITPANAWKSYALCCPCADLLYIFKFHVLKEDPITTRRPLTARIAGENALIIPSLDPSSPFKDRAELHREMDRWIKHADRDVADDEEGLLELLKEQHCLLNLHFIWATLGQNIEDLRGAITDVPPSRLRTLSQTYERLRVAKHAIFPDNPLPELRANLSLSGLKPLFKRPGGRKTQKENDGMRSFQLRRATATAVFHGSPLPEARFWEEILNTARAYLDEAVSDGNAFSPLFEGLGKKGPYLNFAGWVRHLARWIWYFRKLEVMPMGETPFQPTLDELKPFFGPETGIDSDGKAFAFLLGALYGKVLQVQGARGVNVGANALTWLKRLTLRGRDLPELYVKIREKLLAYETERSSKVRDLIGEIGLLGARLGTAIDLDDITTCYFLLLGQSVSTKILPKKPDGKDE